MHFTIIGFITSVAVSYGWFVAWDWVQSALSPGRARRHGC